MAKGLTKTAVPYSLHSLPNGIVESQLKLEAKRKLVLILKTKSTPDQYVSVGDMNMVYATAGMEKRGKWSSPTVLLVMSKKACTVAVPAKSGTSATVALEDTCPALPL